jgi:hypothetical protein
MAKSYLNYLSSLSVQTAYAEATNRTSVDISDGPAVGLDGRSRSESAAELFKSQLRTVKQLYKPEWQKTDETIQDLIKLVTSSGQSAQSAVDSAAARLKELL